MKKFLNKKYIFIGMGIILFSLFSALNYLIFTDSYESAKFRTMQDKISATEEVDLTGLHEIQASGGAIVDFPDLKRKLRHINQKIVIIDGLTQDHGYIYNGYFKEISTIFFGYGQNNPDMRHFIRRLIFTGTTHPRPDLIISESEVAKKYGFGY